MDVCMRIKALLAVLLYLGFFLCFYWFARERVLRNWWNRTTESLDAAARQRARQNRARLTLLSERPGPLHRVEQKLVYSGLAVRFPWLTPEVWILMNLGACALGYFAAGVLSGSWLWGLLAILALQGARHCLMGALMGRNYRLVNDNLLKFLDFLGNYSITAGEVTGILNQISKYLDEPLRSVLDACYYEAQTTGDASLALLSMAEKVEHPQFKELVRNLEVSVRYSADFKALVSHSRRAVREYMRTRQERKSMIKEALVNMVILLGMAGVIFLSVEQLIGAGIREILLDTLPGRISLGVIFGIILLFYGQVRKLDR